MILERPSAFLTYNIAPVHSHQTMVVPKRHLTSLCELSKEELEDIQELVTEGMTLLYKLGYTFVSLLLRDGTHAGKSVEHLHYHLTPETDYFPETDPQRIAESRRNDPRDIMTPEAIAATLRDYERVKKLR
jgi:diadenosine tetraphosphate (Ap4A) HIT family hydrolase